MAKSSKAEDLLKILGRKVTSPTPPKIELKPAPPTPVASPKPKPRPRHTPIPSKYRGHGVHFWLHPEDEKLIREFAVWLLPHRRRVNDSLVIKTILRAAKTGPALLAAYDEAIRIDGRRPQPRSDRQHSG